MFVNKTARLKQMNIWASQHEMDRWSKEAEEVGMSRSAWVRYVLRKEVGLRVAKHTKKEQKK